MKKALFIFLSLSVAAVTAQESVNPVIQSAGAVSTVPFASFTPDPNLEYKIIVDVMTGPEDRSEISFAMNNVARMINLHAMAKIPLERMHVVLAIHNAAIFTALADTYHKERYGVDNPHTPLFKELLDAGVKIVVCGQSLVKREIDPAHLVEGIEVATSALTTLTEYQLRGYALLRF